MSEVWVIKSSIGLATYGMNPFGNLGIILVVGLLYY